MKVANESGEWKWNLANESGKWKWQMKLANENAKWKWNGQWISSMNEWIVFKVIIILLS